jgi:hypothetical protein
VRFIYMRRGWVGIERVVGRSAGGWRGGADPRREGTVKGD